MEAKVLVEVQRNNIVESRHRGWVAVCDKNGNLINGTHSSYPEFFVRSSLKPVQALPFLISGGLKEFKFGIKELAVIVSSHSGESIHTETVNHILTTVGLKEEHLKCGTHMPYNPETARDLLISGQEPTPVFCNCSGKHSGMLAACLLNGWPLENYFEYTHPLQKEIRKHLGIILELNSDHLKWGIDGCGVPTYSFALDKLSRLYSKIVNPESLPVAYQEHFKLIREAFLTYPGMIAGKERVDTVIMESAPGKFISKIGGEAVLGFGLVKEKMALAIKIEDGANRPMLPVIVGSMENIGLDINNLPKLSKLKQEPVYNNLRYQAGVVKPVFKFIQK